MEDILGNHTIYSLKQQGSGRAASARFALIGRGITSFAGNRTLLWSHEARSREPHGKVGSMVGQ